MKKSLLAIGMILGCAPGMSALEMPKPEIPAPGAVIYVPHPHFRWRREADVKIDEIHGIQIARDADFSDIACEDHLEVVSRFVPVKPLAPGKYWWRVRRGEMAWSAPTPFEVQTPKNVIAVPSGSDEAAVARSIQEAATNTPAVVRFEPGEYKLTPEEGKSIATLEKASDLIVDGQGARLVLGGKFLRLKDCRRVTIQNFTVTPNRPAHTQVRVVSKDPTAGTLVVKVEPGHDPDVEHYFGEKNAGSFLACMDPNPLRRGKMLLGAMISAHSKNPPRVAPAPGEPGAFVFSPVDAATLERCPVGGPAIITAYGWHWVVFERGEECTFSNVTASGLPGAFSDGGSSAKSMLACKVKLRAPQDYFGGHSSCGSGRIGEWIEGCEFESLPDDGPAQQSFRKLVKSADGANSLTVAGNLAESPFLVGGRVALVNPRPGDGRGVMVTVTNVTQEARVLRIEMDRPLAELAAAIGRNASEDWKGVFIYVDSPSNEDFVYRHNRHVGGRGHGVKFNGTRAWIADSYFENLNGNAVEAGYPSEYSGHGASDVVISGNTIVRCGWAPIRSTSRSGLGKNLIIRNNRINEVRDTAISVTGYNGVRITGNTLSSSTPPTAGEWVVCKRSINVLSETNSSSLGLPETKADGTAFRSQEMTIGVGR